MQSAGRLLQSKPCKFFGRLAQWQNFLQNAVPQRANHFVFACKAVALNQKNVRGFSSDFCFVNCCGCAVKPQKDSCKQPSCTLICRQTSQRKVKHDFLCMCGASCVCPFCAVDLVQVFHFSKSLLRQFGCTQVSIFAR